MDWDDILWDIRYNIGHLSSDFCNYLPQKLLVYLIAKPNHGFKSFLKLAMSPIGSVRRLVNLSDDIQPRPHLAAQRSPATLAPKSALLEEKLQDVPVADQKDSLFFKLPAELRNAIYRMASADRVFHVAHTAEQRMAVVECRWTPAQRDEMSVGTCCIAPQFFNHNYRSRIYFPPLLVRRSLHKTIEKTVNSEFRWNVPFSVPYYGTMYPQSNKTNVFTLAMTCRRM
jgi:hypothetical protein